MLGYADGRWPPLRALPDALGTTSTSVYAGVFAVLSPEADVALVVELFKENESQGEGDHA